MKNNHGTNPPPRCPASHGFIECSFGTLQTLFLKNLPNVHPTAQPSATLMPFDPFSPEALRREFAPAFAAATSRRTAQSWRAHRVCVNSVGGAS